MLSVGYTTVMASIGELPVTSGFPIRGISLGERYCRDAMGGASSTTLHGSSIGLGHQPFTLVRRVRFPYRVPNFIHMTICCQMLRKPTSARGGEVISASEAKLATTK